MAQYTLVGRYSVIDVFRRECRCKHDSPGSSTAMEILSRLKSAIYADRTSLREVRDCPRSK